MGNGFYFCRENKYFLQTALKLTSTLSLFLSLDFLLSLCVCICAYTCVYLFVWVCALHNTYMEVREQPGVLVLTFHLDRGWVCLLLLLTAVFPWLADLWASGNSSSASHLAVRNSVITDVWHWIQFLYGIELKFKLKFAHLWQVLPIESSV